MMPLPQIPEMYEYMRLARKVTDALDNLYIPLIGHEDAMRMLRESVYMSVPGQPQWNMCLMGSSGTGKTFLIKRFKQEFGRQILPDRPNDIPILVVNTPSNPILKNMSTAILQACKDPFAHMGTEKTQTARIPEAISRLGVCLMVFEEFQNLFKKTDKSLQGKAAQWLKEIENMNMCPIALTGLESITEFVLGSDELNRRFLRNKILGQLSMTDDLSVGQLIQVLESISPLIDQANDAKLDSDHMLARIWLSSAGTMDIIFKMSKSAVLAAFRENLNGRVALRHWSEAFVELSKDPKYVLPRINYFDLEQSKVMEAVARMLAGVSSKTDVEKAK